MNSIALHHKIQTFRKMKETELGMRGKNVDQLFEDLVSDGRDPALY
jgi:hypothetical protein